MDTDRDNPPPEPPLVIRVGGPPPAPTRPRPGFPEALFWCVALWAVQLTGFLLAGLLLLAVEALASGEPVRFLERELLGTGSALKTPAPGAERPPVPPAASRAMAWGFLGAQVAMLGFCLRVIPRRVGPDWKRQLGVRRPALLHVGLAVLVLPGYMILSGGVEDLLVRWTGAKPLPGTEALRGVFGVWPWWLTVLAVGVGPGVVEELWCRGFLGRGLCARYGLIGGVALTSALFGLLHLHPLYALVTAFMGAYLHFVYLCSRSIWVPVLLHALNNGVAVLATLAGVLVQVNANPSGLSPVVYLAAGSLVAFASVAFWTGRAEVQPWGVRAPDWAPEYPAVSAPPAGVEARLGYRPVSPVAVVNTAVCVGVLIYLLTLRRPG